MWLLLKVLHAETNKNFLFPKIPCNVIIPMHTLARYEKKLKLCFLALFTILFWQVLCMKCIFFLPKKLRVVYILCILWHFHVELVISCKKQLYDYSHACWFMVRNVVSFMFYCFISS